MYIVIEALVKKEVHKSRAFCFCCREKGMKQQLDGERQKERCVDKLAT